MFKITKHLRLLLCVWHYKALRMLLFNFKLRILFYDGERGLYYVICKKSHFHTDFRLNAFIFQENLCIYTYAHILNIVVDLSVLFKRFLIISNGNEKKLIVIISVNLYQIHYMLHAIKTRFYHEVNIKRR